MIKQFIKEHKFSGSQNKIERDSKFESLLSATGYEDNRSTSKDTTESNDKNIQLPNSSNMFDRRIEIKFYFHTDELNKIGDKEL